MTGTALKIAGNFRLVQGAGDIRIAQQTKLIPAAQMAIDVDANPALIEQGIEHRKELEDIIHGVDRRILLIPGVCSLLPTKRGIKEFLGLMGWLADLQERVRPWVKIVPRVGFYKPRTRSDDKSWSGAYQDRHMNNKSDINDGLKLCRQVAIEIAELGLGIATEVPDSTLPQYLPDALVTLWWVGARTVASPELRRLTSGLSSQVAFKNPTDGKFETVLDALDSASHSNYFTGPDYETAIESWFQGTGQRGVTILRGSDRGLNYDHASVAKAQRALGERKHSRFIIVDTSHKNSWNPQRNDGKGGYDYQLQSVAFESVLGQFIDGNRNLAIMSEMHIQEGNQPFQIGDDPDALNPKKSCTDPCMSMRTFEQYALHAAREVSRS